MADSPMTISRHSPAMSQKQKHVSNKSYIASPNAISVPAETGAEGHDLGLEEELSHEKSKGVLD